jgi:hypothetical protein
LAGDLDDELLSDEDSLKWLLFVIYSIFINFRTLLNFYSQKI